jgi:hypothetical protein
MRLVALLYVLIAIVIFTNNLILAIRWERGNSNANALTHVCNIVVCACAGALWPIYMFLVGVNRNFTR